MFPDCLELQSLLQINGLNIGLGDANGCVCHGELQALLHGYKSLLQDLGLLD